MAHGSRRIEVADERGHRRQHREIADGRALAVRALLRHHRHEMAGEDALLKRRRRSRGREVGGELLAIGHEIRFEIGNEGRDLGQVREIRRERIERLFDRAARGLFVEFGDLPAMILFRLGRARKQCAEFCLEGRDACFHVAPHRLGQLVEDFRFDDPAVMHRRHAEAERRAQHGDVLLGGLGLDDRQRIVLRGPQVFVDGAPAGAMVLAGEGGWQRRQQFAQAPR